MKNCLLVLFGVLLCSAQLRTQTIWNKSNGTIIFTKIGFADWTQAENQDRISDSVWITRANSQGIFNIKKESAYQTSSPIGTEWALGTTANYSTLIYKAFITLSNNNPSSLIGQDLVLHLISENIYIDIKLLSYGNSSTGAGFSYIRAISGATPVELSTIKVMKRENLTSLLWVTATEINNYGFEIERRVVESQSRGVNEHTQRLIDSKTQWLTVGFVQGAGTSNSPKEYSFTDSKLPAGRYEYRLKQIDLNGTFKYSQSVEVEVGNLPKEFALYQNYPNPFNPVTTIKYDIPAMQPFEGSEPSKGSLVSLRVYDILGKEIATLVNEQQPAGSYEVKFDASHLASGVYFYSFKAGSFIAVKKLLLMK